jgi:hypothetical protein
MDKTKTIERIRGAIGFLESLRPSYQSNTGALNSVDNRLSVLRIYLTHLEDVYPTSDTYLNRINEWIDGEVNEGYLGGFVG